MPRREEANPPLYAQVLHRAPGRLRLRLPRHKGDAAALAEIERSFNDCPEVRATQSNPLTGSVLVLHRGDAEAVERYAAERVGLVLDVGALGPEHGLRVARDRIRGLDLRLKESSGGRVGLRSLAFTGLVVAGAVQFYRGMPLPAGLTLLTQAYKLLEGIDDR